MMRDYQRMAPQKLTDTVLESILWNKVPVRLQKEVKEITDGSVQELLQKLLKAESVIEEQERRAAGGSSSHSRKDQGRINEHRQDPVAEANRSSETTRKAVNAQKRPDSRAEFGMQSVKCFKCSKSGHVAKDCPEKRQNQAARRIVLTEETKEPQDPWLLMLSVGGGQQHW